VRKEAAGGKPALTRYEVIEQLRGDVPLELGKSGYAKDAALPPPPAKFSLIKLLPKTGRTHQLRVHLSAIGYPIVGDTMYGGRPLIHDDFRFERQALHAFQITFVHPVTLNTMTLEAPLPPDITRLLEILRGT
jgi:23S rRNA-/tRNA-specific pseudouridylate synthase